MGISKLTLIVVEAVVYGVVAGIAFESTRYAIEKKSN